MLVTGDRRWLVIREYWPSDNPNAAAWNLHTLRVAKHQPDIARQLRRLADLGCWGHRRTHRGTPSGQRHELREMPRRCLPVLRLRN
jgi:hypothetical protein